METESMLKILICVQTFFPPCSLYIHSLWYQKKKHDPWILRFKKFNTFFYRSVAGLTNWSTVKVSGWVGPAAGRRPYTHTHPVEAETLERSWWRRLENNGRLVWTTALVLSQSLCVSERASERGSDLQLQETSALQEHSHKCAAGLRRCQENPHFQQQQTDVGFSLSLFHQLNLNVFL